VEDKRDGEENVPLLSLLGDLVVLVQLVLNIIVVIFNFVELIK